MSHDRVSIKLELERKNPFITQSQSLDLRILEAKPNIVKRDDHAPHLVHEGKAGQTGYPRVLDSNEPQRDNIS